MMEPAVMLGHLDPANRFVMGGPNMALTAALHREGKPLPKTLFLDVMVEKTQKPNRAYKSSPPWTFSNCKYRREFGKY